MLCGPRYLHSKVHEQPQNVEAKTLHTTYDITIRHTGQHTLDFPVQNLLQIDAARLSHEISICNSDLLFVPGLPPL